MKFEEQRAEILKQIEELKAILAEIRDQLDNLEYQLCNTLQEE